ncbi:hypothetical protein C444_19227 [Haloarcula japonica DSM 6131]|uniref:Uncharacterized protein n=1 Tax=Haloarcula japonica (strain ATCC 49778 / DSM 6131 / JCM 7785 / NBRC 101032 / NCIMB 13157 / TR-1) TaxID=1227453 RepID=M0L3H6_HALJT|nr:hypothetical protein C444_19227 [Haloarcula japonica DSM 6131]
MLVALGLYRFGVIDEKYGIVNVVFLVKFGEKRVSKNCRYGRSKLCMKPFVRLSIDDSVQPVLFIIELDHGLSNRNMIRLPTIFGL